MKKTKLMATFMIFLVLTLPVFSAAQSLTLDKYSGKEDNIDGVVRERGDELNIEVIAKRADGGAISNDDVWLASKKSDGKYYPDYSFNSCEQKPDGSNNCIYSEKEPLPDEYQVQLRDGDTLLKSANFELITDDEEPTSQISYSFTDQGELKIDYTITDREKCSGIKTAQFYLKQGKTKTGSVTKQGSKGDCLLEGSLETTVPSQIFFKGQLCVNATDFFGQFDEECIDFVYDKKAPIIKDSKLMDDSGAFELNHVKNTEDVDVQVVVEVEGDDDVNKVTADLSNLGGSADVELTKLSDNKNFSTTFTITKTDDIKYTIKATDKSGNTATKEFTKTLPLDNAPPTVVSVSTIPEVLGKEGNITVIFSDSDDEGNEGIGVTPGKVRITAEDIISNKEPDKCVKTTEGWMCYLEVKASSSSGDKTVTVNAQDNLGNRMDEYTGKITLDLEVPEGLDVKYEVVGGVTQAIPYPIIGSAIKFTLKGKDINSAEADFTKLGDSKNTPAQSCDKNECFFTQDVKKGTKIGDNKVTFTAYDKASNKKTIDLNVKIYDTYLGEPKKEGFWDVKEVKCMPSKIDRKTVSQMDGYPVYCQVELQSDDTSAQIASVSVREQDCTGDFYKNNVKSLEVIQNEDKPYLSFALEAKEFNENDTATITCPLSIYTLKNNKLVKEPEKETVEAVLNFHGESLGDIYSTTEKQIKDAIKKTERDKDVISKLKEILNWFEKMCQVKNVFVAISMIWQSIQWTFGLVEKSKIPLASAIGYTGRTGGCTAQQLSQAVYAESWYKFLDPFCAALSCRGYQGGGSRWAKLAGGGSLAPWCKNIDKWFDSPELRTMLQSAKQNPSDEIQFLNVKESALLSLVCVCPAGLVHNIDKVKQIDCRYATCLIEDVKEKGLPIEECGQMKSEMKCAYWIGEVWNAVPFFQVIDKLTNAITKIITEPMSLISTALGAICKDKCADPNSAVPWYCTTAQVVSMAGEAYSTITDAKIFKKSLSEPLGKEIDYCAKLDTLKKPYEEKKSESEE